MKELRYGFEGPWCHGLNSDNWRAIAYADEEMQSYFSSMPIEPSRVGGNGTTKLYVRPKNFGSGGFSGKNLIKSAAPNGIGAAWVAAGAGNSEYARVIIKPEYIRKGFGFIGYTSWASTYTQDYVQVSLPGKTVYFNVQSSSINIGDASSNGSPDKTVSISSKNIYSSDYFFFFIEQRGNDCYVKAGMGPDVVEHTYVNQEVYVNAAYINSAGNGGSSTYFGSFDNDGRMCSLDDLSINSVVAARCEISPLSPGSDGEILVMPSGVNPAGGAIQGFTIVNSGTNYQIGDEISAISTESGINGLGQVSATGAGGEISGISVLNGGSNYWTSNTGMPSITEEYCATIFTGLITDDSVNGFTKKGNKAPFTTTSGNISNNNERITITDATHPFTGGDFVTVTGTGQSSMYGEFKLFNTSGAGFEFDAKSAPSYIPDSLTFDMSSVGALLDYDSESYVESVVVSDKLGFYINTDGLDDNDRANINILSTSLINNNTKTTLSARIDDGSVVTTKQFDAPIVENGNTLSIFNKSNNTEFTVADLNSGSFQLVASPA